MGCETLMEVALTHMRESLFHDYIGLDHFVGMVELLFTGGICQDENEHVRKLFGTAGACRNTAWNNEGLPRYFDLFNSKACNYAHYLHRGIYLCNVEVGKLPTSGNTHTNPHVSTLARIPPVNSNLPPPSLALPSTAVGASQPPSGQPTQDPFAHIRTDGAAPFSTSHPLPGAQSIQERAQALPQAQLPTQFHFPAQPQPAPQTPISTHPQFTFQSGPSTKLKFGNSSWNK